MTKLTPATQRVIDSLPVIEERAERATPGPWNCEQWIENDPEGYSVSPVDVGTTEAGILRVDALFIAAARDDVPKLCAAVRELSAALHECREDIDKIPIEELARHKIGVDLEDKHG